MVWFWSHRTSLADKWVCGTNCHLLREERVAAVVAVVVVAAVVAVVALIAVVAVVAVGQTMN